MQNAKNMLQQVLQGLGWPPERARFEHPPAPVGIHFSRVTVELHDGTTVEGLGRGGGKAQADIAAAAEALGKLPSCHPAYGADHWKKLEVEAQAGDALIKLAVYLADEHRDAAGRSDSLGRVENNAHLATVFDRWREGDDASLDVYGPGLGRDNKATVVEALIWRRFRRVLAGDAAVAFAELRDALGPPVEPAPREAATGDS